MDTKETLKNLADSICNDLIGVGFIVQRYNAFTGSIYLKFDYGVCNSLRISDHRGKGHLQYRYNLLTNIQIPREKLTPQGWPRYYFPPSEYHALVDQIIQDREDRILRYGTRYDDLMEKNKAEGEDRTGFWRSCVEVNRMYPIRIEEMAE